MEILGIRRKSALLTLSPVPTDSRVVPNSALPTRSNGPLQMLPKVTTRSAERMATQLTHVDRNFTAINAVRRAILKLPAR